MFGIWKNWEEVGVGMGSERGVDFPSGVFFTRSSRVPAEIKLSKSQETLQEHPPLTQRLFKSRGPQGSPSPFTVTPLPRLTAPILDFPTCRQRACHCILLWLHRWAARRYAERGVYRGRRNWQFRGIFYVLCLSPDERRGSSSRL
jgi:hypothetical protein